MKEKTKNFIKVFFIFTLFTIIGAEIAMTLTEGRLDQMVAAGIGGGLGGVVSAYIIKYILRLDFNTVIKEYYKKD